MNKKFRRLVLGDGIWRYRIHEGRYDRDAFRYYVTVEVKTPGGRTVKVLADEIGGAVNGPVTPGLLRSWIERERP